MIGTSPKNAPWLKNQKSAAQKYLLNPNYTDWKNQPGVALMIYAQIIEDYGWNAYKNVWTSYETGNSSTYPTDDQGKIDEFWQRMSN